MLGRLLAIIRKEMYHILRDPRTLAVVFAMPIMMVLLYGYALNMDIKHIRIGISDRDHSVSSREIIRAFAASEYFDIAVEDQDTDTMKQHIQSSGIKGALIIPRGFHDDHTTKPLSSLQLMVDGSDPTVANALVNYANAIVTSVGMSDAVNMRVLPFETGEQYMYNPELEGSHFIIPGLVAVIMMMVCALLTSITVAREKETGTFDTMIVSPVRSHEIIIGKVLPYVVLAIIDAIFILTFARLVFGIPLHGNLVLLMGLSVLFIYCALAVGLFISSIAATQQVAMMAALVATIMPSVLLSGFIFPIFSMPPPIRLITSIVPAKYFMIIIRGILMKAAPFKMLVGETAALAGLGTFLLILATLRFKMRIHR